MHMDQFLNKRSFNKAGFSHINRSENSDTEFTSMVIVDEADCIPPVELWGMVSVRVCSIRGIVVVASITIVVVAGKIAATTTIVMRWTGEIFIIASTIVTIVAVAITVIIIITTATTSHVLNILGSCRLRETNMRLSTLIRVS